MAMRSPPFVCLCHVPPLHDVTARLQMPGLTTLEIFLTFLRILCYHPLFHAQPYQLISLASSCHTLPTPAQVGSSETLSAKPVLHVLGSFGPPDLRRMRSILRLTLCPNLTRA